MSCLLETAWGRKPSWDGRFLVCPGAPFLLQDSWGLCVTRGNGVEGTCQSTESESFRFPLVREI